MVSAVGERRLAQWMLDVGTPPTQVFGLVASTAGLARGARLLRDLDLAADARTEAGGRTLASGGRRREQRVA